MGCDLVEIATVRAKLPLNESGCCTNGGEGDFVKYHVNVKHNNEHQARLCFHQNAAQDANMFPLVNSHRQQLCMFS